MPYGSLWRRHRRAFAQHFPTTVKDEHLRNQHECARLYVRNLLLDPTDVCEHIR